jgi:hypothetical protein
MCRESLNAPEGDGGAGEGGLKQGEMKDARRGLPRGFDPLVEVSNQGKMYT